MAAPSTDYPALGASTSSSGFTDGLGRRSLAFDREGGTMLERLVVRAELSAFERSLRDRLDRIGAMDDERLAKPRSIERAPDGSLFVFSEFVPGSRLSDLLDATEQEGSSPGVDVALGFLLDVLPALCGLHAGAGFTHGAISPGRTVLTPAGQVVLLDGIFGDALAHLQYTRARLWTEFGIAMPPAAGPPRFDAASDIAQAALSAVTIVLGRQLGDYDYPDRIPALLADVVEVAQIRGSSNFADGLETFFQRALPLPGRKPYTAVDDALIDLRDLARELGLDTCRRALVEFIEGQNGVPAAAAAEGYADTFVYDGLATSDTNGDETQEDEGEGTELELDLDLDQSRGGHADSVETYYDLSSAEETPAEEPPPSPTFADAPAERPDFSEFSALSDAAPAPAPESRPERHAEPFAASGDAFQSDGYQDSSEQDTSAGLEPVSGEPEAGADAAAEGEHDTDHEDTGSVEEPVEDAKSSRRRKRARSVRSRKDKLQSAARPQKLAPPPRPPAPPAPAPAPPIQAAPTPPTLAPLAAAKPSNSGWLVEPSKAASFDPPVPVAPVQPPAPPPRPIALAPPVPVAPIVVAPPVPPPIAIPAPLPRPMAPVIAAPPPIPLQRPAPAVPPPVPSAVKLKTEPPAGYAPPRRPRAEPVEDIYSPRAAAPVDSGGGFPWKMASGGLVLLVAALVAGRAYMTSGTEEEPSTKSPAVATAPVAPTGPAVLPKTGRIQIETEPAGARVLLDGKHVGDSPVTIEAAAGRHTLTLATATGSVRRNVRVEAGKSVTLNVPIFSGWVDVASPIILEVSEDGKLLGTTEQNRLLLRPGRHVLTFTNRDLDYSTVQTVDIEPGEAKTLTLDPKGTVNLNATPWAEVWIDGKKVGDTPLANLEIPLGTREIVFKNNGYVEQRLTRTVRANAPLAISVEMVKP